MNFYALDWSQISEDCKQAIRADLKNNQRISQTIAEANAQGTLFDLPAGARVVVRRSAVPVRLARLNPRPFTDRLVNKFRLPVTGWRGPGDEARA